MYISALIATSTLSSCETTVVLGADAYHADFKAWSLTVHDALKTGRSLLVFVDGPDRKKLGEQAHLHLPYLLEQLRKDPLVCLILSESEVLASPRRLVRFGLEKGAASPEDQKKWEANLIDYVAAANPRVL